MPSPVALALRGPVALPLPLPPPLPVDENPLPLSPSRRGRGGSTAPSTPRRSVAASTSAGSPKTGTASNGFTPKLMRPSQLSPQAKRRLAAEGITLGDDDHGLMAPPPPPPFALSPPTRQMTQLKLPSDAADSAPMSRGSTMASSDPASPPTPYDLSPPAMFSPDFQAFASDVFGSAWPGESSGKRVHSAPYYAPDHTSHDF